MKTLLTLVLIFSTMLFARENPFEPTNAYEEEAARMIEINEVEEDYDVEFQQEQQYVNTIYEKMNKPEPEPMIEAKPEMKKPEPKPTITKEEITKLIKDAQKQTVKETKQIVEKAVKQEAKSPEQVVYVKPRLDVMYEKEILPFVKVEYDNDKIDIHSKYKVSKRLSLPGKKKIILDFDAKENFYTKRANLESTNFTKIAVGNHKKEGFFRIVIELAETPSNYEVSYDNDMVTIVKLYDM